MAGCAWLLLVQAVLADELASPGFSGPLQPNANPFAFDGGAVGRVYVSGQLSGIGLLQNHAVSVPHADNARAIADISNAQVEVQTTEGPWQFYLQLGAYSLPAVGTPYLRANEAVSQLYGPLPVAYLKAVLSPEFSIIAGSLPTLIGAESTFTFQNMNIERGLLWNQEPAISRGVQLNYASNKWNASVSFNDGYYSGKYNWISGSVSTTVDTSHSIAITAGSHLSANGKATTATPLAQNNSRILDLIYTYSHDTLTITPYLQYTRVSREPKVGIDRSANTYGAATLIKYAFSSHWSLGARAEYLNSTGGGCGEDINCTPTNLLYGTWSSAWSLTLTPTYQRHLFFARCELSYVRAHHAEPGSAFGSSGTRDSQTRAMAEVGVLF